MFLARSIEFFTERGQPGMALRMKSMCLIGPLEARIKAAMDVDRSSKRGEQRMFVLKIGPLFHTMRRLQVGVARTIQQQTAIAQYCPKNHLFLDVSKIRQRQALEKTRMILSAFIEPTILTFTRGTTVDICSRPPLRTRSEYGSLTQNTWPRCARITARLRAIFDRRFATGNNRKHPLTRRADEHMAWRAQRIAGARAILGSGAAIIGDVKRMLAYGA